MSWPPVITGEILINGSWIDITADLYTRDDLVITRGAKDEAGRPDPCSCSFTLNNRSGDYSPYNPTGPYYGFIGRNTPFRLKVDSEIRVAVELTSLPQRWDLSGQDVYVPVAGYGIRKRLGIGGDPLSSALYRGNTRGTPPVVAYWPCEDRKNSRTIASAIGGPPMYVNGSVDFASYSNIPASNPLPTLKGCYWDGTIAAYTVPSPNTMQLRFIMHCPDSTSELPDKSIMMDLHNTGTAGLWRIIYDTGGALELRVDDRAYGNIILEAGPFSYDVQNKDLLVSLELTQNGTGVDWKLVTLQVGDTFGLVETGTLASRTIGRATRVFVDPQKLDAGLTIGHIAVHPVVTTVFDLSSELNAWIGETAGNRISRLCDQEGVPFTAVGNMDDTALMGPQLPLALLPLLDECADADAGTLFEPRTSLGLAYRALSDMYNQTAVLDLDYALGQVSDPFEPTPDDQLSNNDVTAQSPDGTSARVVLETGRMSVSDPSDTPPGIGRYATTPTFNLDGAEGLADAAGWAVAKGTVDEARYAQITVNLGSPKVRDAGKDVDAKAVDVDDRITVSNPKAGQSPDQIQQLARGYTETLRAGERVLAFNCAPASPYEVLQPGTTGKGRIGCGSSTLAADYTSSATSLSVSTSSPDELWTTAAADFPFNIRIAGEVITVTNCTGSSSPQTMTVTRSVNGVVKAQTSGEAVEIEPRARIGF